MATRLPQPSAPSTPLLSVWPTGQRTLPAQFTDGGYLPATAQDHRGMRPAIAAYAVTSYTRPGDTVLDPECGAGTVLVEALRHGRHAIGLTTQQRWWTVARANISAAKRDGAESDGMLLDATPGHATHRLAGHAGTVTLLLTSWRPVRGERPIQPVREELLKDTGEEASSATRLRATLTACRPLLRPGGHVIVTVPPHRHHGRLLDLPGQVQSAARAAGLQPADHCMALVTPIRADRITVPTGLAQRRATARHQRTTGHPVALTAHHDVLVFRAPCPAAEPDQRQQPEYPPWTHSGPESAENDRDQLLRAGAA